MASRPVSTAGSSGGSTSVRTNRLVAALGGAGEQQPPSMAPPPSRGTRSSVGGVNSRDGAPMTANVLQMPSVIKDEADGTKPHQTATMSEMFMEAAHIEDRLRRHLLELIEPTITKQRLLDTRVKQAQASADKLNSDVLELKRLTEGQESLRNQIDAFRVELAEWNRERRDHEQQVGDRTSLLETESNDVRKTVERKTADIAAVNRAVKGFGDNIGELRTELSEIRRYFNDRVEVGRDKAAKLRDEVETRICGVESEQLHINDRLVGHDTDIAHLKHHIDYLSTSVAQALDGVTTLEKSKVAVESVAQQQSEFREFASNLEARVSGLSSQFGSMVHDVKAHFETASNTMVQTTAGQMDSLRIIFNEGVRKVDVALKDVSAFLRKQEAAEGELTKRLEDSFKDTRAELESAATATKEQLKKQERQCMDISVEVKYLQSVVRELEVRTGNKNSSNGGTYSGGGGISKDVVSMLLESAMISVAMDMKDDHDRKRIALFGYRGGEAPDTPKVQHNGKTCSLPELDGGGWQTARGGMKFRPSMTPRRRGLAESGEVAAKAGEGPPSLKDPVVMLDTRCLSCSGNQATVLAGFKMACLQYAPSPVEYEKSTYSRSELIKLRLDLLEQVKDQLRQIE